MKKSKCGVGLLHIGAGLFLSSFLSSTALGDPALIWSKASGPWAADMDGNFGAIAVHPASPNTIFVASIVMGPGIFKSTDGGATWTAKNTGFDSNPLTGKYFPVSKIVISPSNPNVIYLGTAVDNDLIGPLGHIYRSVNGGESWQRIDGQMNIFGIYQIQGAVFDLDVHPQNSDTVYAGVAGQGVMKTTNGGADWSTVYAAGLNNGKRDYFNVVRVLPTQPNTVFFSGFTYYTADVLPGPPVKFDTTGTEGGGYMPFPLRKSTDGGGTWNTVATPSSVALYTDLQFEQASGDLYLSTIAYRTPVFIYFGNRGIFKSVDSGANWQSVNSAGFGSLDQIPFVAMSANNSSATKGVFASTGLGNLVIATTDRASHWLRLDPCLLNAFIGRSAVAGSRLFILTSVGIYSADVSSLATPEISSVSPTTLSALALPQTQLLRVLGSGFTAASTLTFNDGVNAPYTGRVPIFVSSGELDYNITVGPNEANWTVQVINGEQQSNLGTFSVVSTGMSLSYGGTAIIRGDQSPSVAKGTDFGTIVYGFQSATRTFTISNTFNRALNLTGVPRRVQISGDNAADFLLFAPLPATPVGANGGSSTIQLAFEPGGLGVRTATISIPNDDPNKNPYTFTVQGTGMTQIRVDPSLEFNGVESLNGDQNPTVGKGTDFGSADMGAQSATHSFRFYNYGTISMLLTGSVVQVSGANSEDFAIVSVPTSPIASGAYATVAVRFQPTGAGARNASLQIYYDATYGLGATSPYTVGLRGTGTLPVTRVVSLSGNMAFGNVPVGASEQHDLVISNNGNSTLTVTGITYPSGFSGSWNGAIAQGSAQTVRVTFTPLSVGSYGGGSVVVGSDATGGSGSMAISGSGVNPPRLTVNRQGGDVLLTWPADIPGFTVESATNLPPVWRSNAVLPAIVGGSYTITNPIAEKSAFFRLRR
ncbi:MAG TPA: choice-of-anchor D domain-containing protein [Candidatus Paceibacterota bacterium]|nr:choice-of-anchor D domain-containing protein [Candidatus Paceibacterota bacterium]